MVSSPMFQCGDKVRVLGADRHHLVHDAVFYVSIGRWQYWLIPLEENGTPRPDPSGDGSNYIIPHLFYEHVLTRIEQKAKEDRSEGGSDGI